MKLLFMFLFTIGSSNSDIVWNEVVDQGIVTTTEELIERHADSISIPDIEETFKETILGIIPFTINLRINGALFWNLTTVKRKGNVKVVQDNKTKNITFLLPLGLNDLHLKVKDFFINFFGLTIFG
ncbi:hypothetical protein O3M35_009427 [Rhynocoris fuscipes]|uniref:Uncharacterized protein n=1 Tax=Rhynocoris fuscipes TaxID=488301 RepID=A0AAW1D3Q0_9HEMI